MNSAPREPTAAEAFATVRRGLAHISTIGCSDACPDVGAASAALSVLERRMGAMAQALRLMRESVRNDLEGGPMPRALRSACAEADAALTDAPPVFTLEEVREAVTKAATGATITHGQRVTPDQFARWVTERLSRDKPVTKPTPRTSHRCEEECCLPK